MEEKNCRTALLRHTSWHAIAQALSVAICTAVLFLFAALNYAQITLPKYTANYAQKDTQQVVNLIITVVATVIGILLNHCRRYGKEVISDLPRADNVSLRLTNEAETKSELRNAELTIPRLHVHIEAAGGAHAAMGVPAMRNKAVRQLVAFYMFAIVISGFLNSVLSVIFVIEPVISKHGFQSPAYIPIGIDIPWEWEGIVVDPCSKSIAEPGCSYDLAITALTSQLVTYLPYTVGENALEIPAS